MAVARPQTKAAPTRRAPDSTRKPRRQAGVGTVALFVAAAAAVVQFYRPPQDLFAKPFGPARRLASLPTVQPSLTAFGASGEVKVRFALPERPVDYPLDVTGDASDVSYAWVSVGDTAFVVDSAALRPLHGANLMAPAKAGLYQLALVRGAERQVVDGPTLAVMVPFSQKLGSTLNGYRIGTYIAERLKGGGSSHDRPEGFVEVNEQTAALPVTKHLRLGDFIARDGQETWPRYTALNPRLLDKLELVIAEVARLRGDTSRVQVTLDIHSGFRTPFYNRTVARSAKDSRHQYGDAADVTIDANFDGRYTAFDSRLVALAVEKVEKEHPELAGGLGLYTSRRYNTPYVHIDARGTKVRWRG